MVKSYTNYSRLTIIDRTKIELLNNMGKSQRYIAAEVGCSVGTINYELHRYGDIAKYRAKLAQHRADKERLTQRKQQKITDVELRHNIERMLKLRWSPEIIMHRLNHRISHTSIYNMIRTCRPEWKKYLIYQRKRKYHKGRAAVGLIPFRTGIDMRPEVQFGDWEADTVIGKIGSKSCLAVFVEKVTRYYKVLKMNNKTADEMLKASLSALNGNIVNSVTYDNGTENANHWVLNMMIGCASYFCRPYRSGDKGLIEQRNKMLRVFLPKGISFNLIDEERISNIAKAINDRPMKCLNWKTPTEAFSQASSLQLFN